jgi:hypothetical protein
MAVPQGQIPPTRSAARRGRARTRRDSGFYLPVWSLGLMLLVVVMIAGGIVALVIGLGGRTPPESAPVVIVSSPVPTQLGAVPLSPATPTIPPEIDPAGSGGGVSEPFALSGPTLESVVFTATPRPISIGQRVMVVDVGIQQLNVRDRAGTVGTSVVFRAEEETVFEVVGGPEQADGLTWWRIQSPDNPARAGWAASNYLRLLVADD